MTTHERFTYKWNNAEFGVKTRVFKEHLQQTIEYILKNPNYSKEFVMLDIIECIERKALEVKNETNKMYNTIKTA